MILDLIHIKQPNNYSCGPICLEMVLAYFRIETNYDELTKLTKVHSVHGTDNDEMIKVLKFKGLAATEKTEADIADITEALDKGWPVIINYVNPESGIGHYAVIKGYSEDILTLADPKNGDNYTISFKKFLNHWSNSDGTVKRWMLVAQPTG